MCSCFVFLTTQCSLIHQEQCLVPVRFYYQQCWVCFIGHDLCWRVAPLIQHKIIAFILCVLKHEWYEQEREGWFCFWCWCVCVCFEYVCVSTLWFQITWSNSAVWYIKPVGWMRENNLTKMIAINCCISVFTLICIYTVLINTGRLSAAASSLLVGQWYLDISTSVYRRWLYSSVLNFLHCYFWYFLACKLTLSYC